MAKVKSIGWEKSRVYTFDGCKLLRSELGSTSSKIGEMQKKKHDCKLLWSQLGSSSSKYRQNAEKKTAFNRALSS